jgi:type III secretory pathway component EscS
MISSAAFIANVVSTGLVVGYVVQKLTQLQKEKIATHQL